jgi:hypothetical protein
MFTEVWPQSARLADVCLCWLCVDLRTAGLHYEELSVCRGRDGKDNRYNGDRAEGA